MTNQLARASATFPLALFGTQRQPRLEGSRLQIGLFAAQKHQGPKPYRRSRRLGIARRLLAGERIPGRGPVLVPGRHQRPAGCAAEPDVLRRGRDGPHQMRQRACRRPVGSLRLGKEEGSRQKLRPQGWRCLSFYGLEHQGSPERRLQRFDLRQGIGVLLRRERHFPIEAAQCLDGQRAGRLGTLCRHESGPGQRLGRPENCRQYIRCRSCHRLNRNWELCQVPGGDAQGSGIGAGVHDRLRQPRHGIDCVVEGLIERSIPFQQELEAQRRSLDQAGVCLTENAHPAPITAAGARLAQNALASGGVVERG